MAFSSVPARLGPFVVRDVLCTISAGALLRVEDPLVGRPRTVMLLDPDLGAWPRKLKGRSPLPAHPRLCALSEGAPGVALEDDRTFYYVGAESLSGWTALDEIAREGAIRPMARAVRLGAEAAEALACAHAAGLHHGHLEPGCLFIQTYAEEDEGHVKVLGMGLGVVAAPHSRADRYRHPHGSGRAPRSAAARVAGDLLALGGVLYHMLTGEAPCLPSLPIPDDLPEPLSRVILRALHPDPARRYPTASALRQALLDTDLPPPEPEMPEAVLRYRPRVGRA